MVKSKNFEEKRSEKKKYCMRMRNGCETDLVALRFALKAKTFFAKPAHPSLRQG
jgi:hypothetical protein